MNFFYPWLLILIPLPILLRLILSYFPGIKLFNLSSHKNNALRLPTYTRIKDLVEQKHQLNLWHKNLLIPFIIWSLLIISLAQPLWQDKHQPLPMTGRDLMFLIDVSGSMRKMDFVKDELPISRLDMVKEVASEFVKARTGDRVGLILFGNKPHLRAPLSHDRKAISELIQHSEIALAGESTAIGDAIGLAIKRMQNLTSQSRVIILLTDGANNEGIVNPRQAAELAALKGIKIYTIGIGGAEAPAPNPYGVWSSEGAEQYEKAVLQDVAQLTQGYFFHVLDTQALKITYAQLDQLEPAFTQDIHKHLAKPLYPWSLSLLFLVSLVAVWRGWLPIFFSYSNSQTHQQRKNHE